MNNTEENKKINKPDFISQQAWDNINNLEIALIIFLTNLIYNLIT